MTLLPPSHIKKTSNTKPNCQHKIVSYFHPHRKTYPLFLPLNLHSKHTYHILAFVALMSSPKDPSSTLLFNYLRLPLLLLSKLWHCGLRNPILKIYISCGVARIWLIKRKVLTNKFVSTQLDIHNQEEIIPI